MQGWCNMSREELEENSPSRRDGISLKKETYLRKSYCTFLKVLGIRLQVPQITIATASIMCHRFFLIQSHSKNDRMTVATACMFLAGKSTENPRSLRDVVIVSYAIIHNKDKTAAQRIKQRELYQQQKVLILLGERLVLVTLAFDLKVDLPYIPLARLIMKYNLKEVDSFPQVSWSFVNDGLWSLLCLQFKPHQIALGAFCLAAEHLKVKLPSDGEKLWWEDHDITGRQLEEIKSQILELYSKMKVAVVVPSSQRSEITQSDSSGHHQVVSSSSLSFHKEEPGLREGVDHHGKGDKAAAGPEKEAPQPEEGQLLEEGDDIEPPWKGKKQLDSSSSFARSGGFIRMVGRKRSRDESAQNDGRY